MEWLISVILRVPPILIAIAFHEFAHGLIAKKYGDPTAEQQGRLTINPIKHLDPLGTLMLFLGPIGWAKPVPVNPMNLRDPFRDMVPIAIAGPAMNFILAIASAVVIKLLIPILPDSYGTSLTGSLAGIIIIMLYISLQINVGLAVFNLIPLYPLDGSKVLMGIIPRDKAVKLMQYGNYFALALIILAISGKLSFIIGPIMWIVKQITLIIGIPNIFGM